MPVATTDALQGKERKMHFQDEHHEILPVKENEESNDDLEKHASHKDGNDLSRVGTEDGEYVVTAKTWLVVVVRQPYSTWLCAAC